MKSKQLWAIALASALTSTPLFAQTEAAATEEAEKRVLLTVNGYEVTPQVYLAYRGLRQRPEPRDPQQAQLTLLNELATILMISQDAEKQGVDKKPEHAIILDIGRRLALSEAAVQDVLTNFAPTQEGVMAAYEEAYKDMPKEYKARHILVKEEPKALVLIAELDSGADFAELAKEHSTDPGSGSRGGDLGWFTTDRMVPSFGEAVVAQEPGVHSKQPVQSQFGYHIILVEDSREQDAPKFEDVRDDLVIQLRQQAVADYVEQVRNNTDIQIMGQQASAPGQAGAEAKN